jgi:hypothetical protein
VTCELLERALSSVWAFLSGSRERLHTEARVLVLGRAEQDHPSALRRVSHRQWTLQYDALQCGRATLDGDAPYTLNAESASTEHLHPETASDTKAGLDALCSLTPLCTARLWGPGPSRPVPYPYPYPGAPPWQQAPAWVRQRLVKVKGGIHQSPRPCAVLYVPGSRRDETGTRGRPCDPLQREERSATSGPQKPSKFVRRSPSEETRMTDRLSRRLLPQTFTCQGCQEIVTLRQDRQDWRRGFCSKACKLLAWKRLHSGRQYTQRCVCGACGRSFLNVGLRKYCSQECLDSKARTKKPPIPRTCIQCSAVFMVPYECSKGVTCSKKCQTARLKEQLRGKKYRMKAFPHVCVSCEKAFTNSRPSQTTCARCLLRIYKRGKGKYRERCKRAGVPYVAGVTALKVFARDGYRCHLCGCATPKRLRGKNRPTSPELDHIIPIAAGGGHTWENVACACRSCNGKKSDKPLGQLRLAV